MPLRIRGVLLVCLASVGLVGCGASDSLKIDDPDGLVVEAELLHGEETVLAIESGEYPAGAEWLEEHVVRIVFSAGAQCTAHDVSLSAQQDSDQVTVVVTSTGDGDCDDAEMLRAIELTFMEAVIQPNVIFQLPPR